MMKPARIALFATLGLALVAIVLATVANKRWWMRQVAKRWQMSRWVKDELLNRWVLEVEGYSTEHPERYTLAQLRNDYFKGSDGWTRQGEELTAPDGTRPVGEGIVTAEPNYT